MSLTACPDRGQLTAYAVGRLPDDTSDAIAAHVDSCPDCAAVLAALEEPDDPFTAQLRGPADNPYAKESECRSAVARARTILEQSRGGQTLGEYQLIEELGHGGMGRVYKAWHTKLNRLVAVKILPRGRADDRQAIARFEREISAVGRLVHPNIVQAYDAREIEGTPVLVMEYVDGWDLGEILRRMGRVPVAEACELVRQTALAAECAHEHGLIHRDIKPSNIMLSTTGGVKLLDLGLVRSCEEALAVAEMTGAGQAVGTTDYMAPEQLSDSHTVDVRADIYSLGCTLYKLLTGLVPLNRPARRRAPAELAAQVPQTAPPVQRFAPEVPDGLAAVLDRMLATEPAGRFATAGEVVEALTPWCGGADLSILMQPAGAAERPRQPALVRRWRWVAAMAGLLLLAGGVGFVLGMMVRIKNDATPAATTSAEGNRGTGFQPVAEHGQNGRATAEHAQDGSATAEHRQDGRATAARTQESEPSAASSHGQSAPGAAKADGVTAAQLKKLHYDWKKGQSYVYRVRIVGERGNDTENRSGEVTYKVKSTQLDEIQLVMTSNLKYEATPIPRRYALLPGRHVGFVSDVDRTKEATIRIDPHGRLLESKGEAPLPYLLGDLSELVIEPLPQAEKVSWTIGGDPGVAVVSLQYPFWRFSQPGFREGVPAAEKTVYTVEKVSGDLDHDCQTL